MRAQLTVIPLAAALAALLSAGPARADTVTRSFAGAACVPSDTTMSALAYQVVNGGIEFAPNATGSVVFFCPVPVENGSYFGWLGVDNDDDGAATGDYYVKADFMRRSKATGVSETVCTVYSQSATPTFHPCLMPSGFPMLMTFDHATYINVVKVTLYRRVVPADGQSIRFLGLEFNP